MVHPEKWWTERAILVRRALQKGFISNAYVIAREHGLSHGADFAEAEWLAGWIVLRFLEEGQAALDHFSAMFEAVRYPVSRARGAYWADPRRPGHGRARTGGFLVQHRRQPPDRVLRPTGGGAPAPRTRP